MRTIQDLTADIQVDCATELEQNSMLAIIKDLGYKEEVTPWEYADTSFYTFPSIVLRIAKKEYYTCVSERTLMDGVSEYVPASDFLTTTTI